MKAFTKDQTAAARSLAISYMAFCEIDFTADNDPLATLITVERLLETQEAVGTELMPTTVLGRMIDSAKREWQERR
tara:strand:+ start:180 stop:407 length:228 start_codon:yes stop_codon:yes gene_type:complete